MLIDDLIAQGPVITDGAWGTQLQSLGLAGGECPDHWNLSHPDVVAKVPGAYADAGSQIVLIVRMLRGINKSSRNFFWLSPGTR